MEKKDIKLDNGQVISVNDPNYAEYASQGANQPPVTPVAPTAPQAQPNAPSGSVAISGAEYNTKEKQQAGFTNIQPIGNTLYGIPKPVVPGILPQQDLTNAMNSEVLETKGAEASNNIGFNEQQIAGLNAANLRTIQGKATEADIKNLDYAKGKGWTPTEAKTETLQPASAGVIGEPTPAKSTTDQIFEMMFNMGNLRAEAKAEAAKDQDLMGKGEAIATSSTLVNKLRTELQNKQIYDIKDQDVVRAKPILTSQIAGQLSEMSREQKLDAMIMTNNYNNALVELQIAQGNYDRAREIVNETADDVYNASVDQINALQFKNQIETIEADRLKENLTYERDLSMAGYVHLKSPEDLKGLKESEIFRDPVSGRMYLKPEPTVSQIMEVNGRQVGIDDKGNIIKDFGAVKITNNSNSNNSSGIDIPGVDTTNMTEEEIKELQGKIQLFNSDISTEVNKLARGGDWGKSWNFIKNKYPTMTNEEVDNALNAWQYNPSSQSSNDNQSSVLSDTTNDNFNKPVNKTTTITAKPSSINWNSSAVASQWNDSKKYLGIE